MSLVTCSTQSERALSDRLKLSVVRLSLMSTLDLHSAEGATVSHDVTMSCCRARFILSTNGVAHLFSFFGPLQSGCGQCSVLVSDNNRTLPLQITIRQTYELEFSVHAADAGLPPPPRHTHLHGTN